MSLTEQQEIINQFRQKAFFCKEIHFGHNIKANFYNYHLFELINSMQEKRLINLRNRKICLINYELGEHFLINEKDINDKETINVYYLLAKEVLKKKSVRKKLFLLNKTLRFYNYL